MRLWQSRVYLENEVSGIIDILVLARLKLDGFHVHEYHWVLLEASIVHKAEAE